MSTENEFHPHFIELLSDYAEYSEEKREALRIFWDGHVEEIGKVGDVLLDEIENNPLNALRIGARFLVRTPVNLVRGFPEEEVKVFGRRQLNLLDVGWPIIDRTVKKFLNGTVDVIEKEVNEGNAQDWMATELPDQMQAYWNEKGRDLFKEYALIRR
jgi:hypothetical protein